jgi:RND family efflux transporter MFP subunit
MKKFVKWIVAVVVLAAVAGGAWRAVSARKSQQDAAPVAVKSQASVELAASDIAQVQMVELAQGQPISGSLKAANSAFVKAKVAGDLQGLTVREGDAVKAGQVIARVDSAEYQARVTQAQRSADAAKAQIDIAQRTYDNNKALVNQGFISATALDTSVASLEAAKSTHQAALAAVDVARKALDDTVLKAPISGWVSQRLTQPGERVGPDARVVEIVDLSRLELEAPISTAESVDVRVGQVATLQIEGRADPVMAKVVRINPTASAGSRSVLVYLSVAPHSGLRQGLFAQGTLGTARVQTLAVPVNAVRSDKPAPYLQMIENNAVVHKTVELGARGDVAGETMVAIKNIAAHAQFIRPTAGFIIQGTAVKVTAAAPAAPASATANSAAK